MNDPDNDDYIPSMEAIKAFGELLEQNKGGTILLVEEELIDPADIDPKEVH